MLNDSHRTKLRIAMELIEEKMKAIQVRLAQPDESGVMFEIRNDLSPEIHEALPQQIEAVYAVMEEVKHQFALRMEMKPLSRELLRGLPQLWVMLQECESRRLRGYGAITEADAAVLDPLLARLARLLYDMEMLIFPAKVPTDKVVGRSQP